jgi:hypothetical protein
MNACGVFKVRSRRELVRNTYDGRNQEQVIHKTKCSLM